MNRNIYCQVWGPHLLKVTITAEFIKYFCCYEDISRYEFASRFNNESLSFIIDELKLITGEKKSEMDTAIFKRYFGN